MAFLSPEYNVLALIVPAVLLVIGYKASVEALVALSFLVGAFCSDPSSYSGMYMATHAKVRTAISVKVL